MGENLFRDLTAPLMLDGATGTQLQKCGNTSIYRYLSRCGRKNSRNDFENGGLSGTVRSDDTHTLSLRNVKINIMKGVMLPIALFFAEPQRLLQTV